MAKTKKPRLPEKKNVKLPALLVNKINTIAKGTGTTVEKLTTKILEAPVETMFIDYVRQLGEANAD